MAYCWCQKVAGGTGMTSKFKFPKNVGAGVIRLPSVSKLEDIGEWPNALATETAILTIAAIVQHGFHGVIFQSTTLSNGKYLEQFHFNLSTPEGSLVKQLLKLARIGKSVPLSIAMACLEREYRELGLPLPGEEGAAK